MEKCVKDLFISMVKTWNQFNPQKSVNAEFEENEFNKGKWSLNIILAGMVGSDFIAFLLPSLMAYNCIWYMGGVNNTISLHIQ